MKPQLFDNSKRDLLAGFLVALIALPLCLGIAKASGFPPIAGIYTAIVGGLFATFFTNSALTIKGPAAGLIVISLGAVEAFGHGNMDQGYHMALAAIIVAGFIQVIFSLFKMGRFSDFFPPSVIHGLLASIGIIIVSKQVHVALGVTPLAKDPLGLIVEIPQSLLNLNPEIALISLISLFVIYGMRYVPVKWFKKIPSPLLVLLVAIPMTKWFDLEHDHDYVLGQVFHISSKQALVDLPSNFLSSITFPDFSALFTFTSLEYIALFAIIGSIESVVSTKAIDQIDPQKRKTNFDRDLLAIGLGNMFAGFIGGLPMISEVVRSRANIDAGGQTKWTNFYHGLFLLFFVAFLTPFIHLIPNAALAAMLIATGIRLASPKEFVNMKAIGFPQLITFLTTIVVTLATDMLIGILVGVLVLTILNWYLGVEPWAQFQMKYRLIDKGDSAFIRLQTAAVFSNFIQFKAKLATLSHQHVRVDFSMLRLIDASFLSQFELLKSDWKDQGRLLESTGLDSLQAISEHPFSNRVRSSIRLLFNLTARQKKLEVLSRQMGASFLPKKQLQPALRDILYFKSHPLQYAENVISFSNEPLPYQLLDVHANEALSLALHQLHFSALMISLPAQDVPSFVLEKETWLERMMMVNEMADIDFDEDEAFSNCYFLKSAEEQAVRNLFDVDFRKQLLEYRYYEVESNGTHLFIHKAEQLLNATELLELQQYGQLWIARLTQLLNR
jgi:MFS superfamily sulfate permease-like transporter